MQIDQSIILKKIVEFPRHNVSVVEQRIEAVGSSLFYVAEEKPQRKSFYGSSFLIKVSVATTQEQARRSAAEVRALRRVRDHPSILKMIDSGCSEMNQTIGENKEDDAEAPLDEDRMYCLLFKECPRQSVRDIMEKHRCRKSTWMNIKIVMGIFRQMALAVSVLHAKESRVIHMDLRPDHFGLCKPSKGEATGCKYMVKLIGAGCAVEGSMSLASTTYRNSASRLINATTSKRYRAPEMVNLLLANELTDKVDIWALGCCLYGLLFLRDCFQDESELDILEGTFRVPHEHPYSNNVLYFVSRMLEVDAEKRLDIHEVIACVDALTAGKSLPPKRRNLMLTPNHGGMPFDTQLCQAWRDGLFDPNSNESSQETQWLEFVPDSSNGSCVRRLAQPITPLATFSESSSLLPHSPPTRRLSGKERKRSRTTQETRKNKLTSQ